MNITELEKIAKQIKKYQLEDEIRDIENWLRNLNEKQIGNFLSLEIYPLKQLQVLKRFLIDLEALNGNYYLEDIKLINDSNISDEIAYSLMAVATNKDSLESKHHREDMKLIADAKSDNTSRRLNETAICKNSLESKYHREDMELISKAKIGVITSCLSYVACNNNSLKSDYHREDMKRLANAKDDKDANEIYDNIIKQYEVKNKKDYVTFQEKIDAIHQNAVEYTDGDTTKELDDSVFTLK